ncbi:MAG: TSUP family transporter [Candidatus Dactylopiibacterium sp.]|nr:TSUP family transporter [Candidatus Dactylopiibacterium sp.]
MEWALLLSGAFLAGLVDAVVGGGGLIQLPLLIAVFPNAPISILFGTNKVSSIAGTGSAAWQYAKRIRIPWDLAVPASTAALIGAASGAAVVSYLPSSALRPLVLALLVVVGAYTWFKPDFGRSSKPALVLDRRKVWAAVLGLSIGFYDGFFGPGTGSFLIFGFVRLFGMDMLHASAASKFVNLATNVAALAFFLSHDGVMWKVGLGMAVANVIGAQIGTRLAVRHGNRFIRWLLLAVVSVLIVKLASDLVL